MFIALARKKLASSFRSDISAWICRPAGAKKTFYEFDSIYIPPRWG
jgi:hypothetical protein